MTAHDISIIELKKVQLISMMTRLYDIDLLEKIENILLADKNDWCYLLSNDEKTAIDAGLDDVKNGRLISHEKVTESISKRYKHIEKWNIK